MKVFCYLIVSCSLFFSACGLIADSIEDKIRGKQPKEQIKDRVADRVGNTLRDNLLEQLGLDPGLLKDAQPLNFAETVSQALNLPGTKVPGELRFNRRENFNMAAFRRYMKTTYGVNLAVERSEIDALTGRRVSWLRQVHQGIAVYGAYYRTIAGADGNIKRAFGYVYDQVDVSISANVSSADQIAALSRKYPDVADWLTAPEDTASFKNYPERKALVHPGEIVIVPAGMHPEQRHELCYRMRIDGLEPDNHHEVFVGATSSDVVFEVSLVKQQKCKERFSPTTATVATKWYGKRRVPVMKVCLDSLTTRGDSIYRAQFGYDQTPLPFQVYALRGGTDQEKRKYLNAYYTTPITAYHVAANDLTDNDNRWDDPIYLNRGYLDAHWSLMETWKFYQQRYGRTDYANKKEFLEVEFENPGGTVWNPIDKTISLDIGTFEPETDLHSLAHEYTHAMSEKSANFIYRGESGAIEEAICDIFSLVISDHLGLPADNWVYGHYQGKSGDRNFKDPYLHQHPKYYQGKYWKNTASKKDDGHVHTNLGVAEHWFYLIAAGAKGKNEKGQAYDIHKIGMQKSGDIVYRAMEYYLGRSSNYALMRQATAQAAQDVFGTCSPELKAVEDAWYAVGVGEPHQLCDDVWLEFHTIPAQEAQVNIFLSKDREVTVVKNQYKTTKMINFPESAAPSRWVVSNNVDNSVVKANLPFPKLSMTPQPESETFRQLGIALELRSPQDSAYTPEDFDRDFMLPGGYTTEDGLIVNKYRHPFQEGTVFWSTPQIKIPYLSTNFAVRFGELDPSFSTADNIFRGFLLRMEGPDANFFLVPHFYEVENNPALLSDAAVFEVY